MTIFVTVLPEKVHTLQSYSLCWCRNVSYEVCPCEGAITPPSICWLCDVDCYHLGHIDTSLGTLCCRHRCSVLAALADASSTVQTMKKMGYTMYAEYSQRRAMPHYMHYHYMHSRVLSWRNYL